MKYVWLWVAWLQLGWLDKSYQFGVKFEEGSYRRVSVHISGVSEPSDCGNFLAKFEVISLFLFIFKKVLVESR